MPYIHVIELLGRKVTRKAKIVYTHTPEWECWDRLKQAPYTRWASSSWLIELHAVPQEQDEEGNFVDLEPYWMRLEELTRDDIIPTEIWDVLLDAVDDKCRASGSTRGCGSTRRTCGTWTARRRRPDERYLQDSLHRNRGRYVRAVVVGWRAPLDIRRLRGARQGQVRSCAVPLLHSQEHRDRLATEIPAAEYTIAAELQAFRETCTPHDGRRLANALRHVLGRPDLAAEVEATS